MISRVSFHRWNFTPDGGKRRFCECCVSPTSLCRILETIRMCLTIVVVDKKSSKVVEIKNKSLKTVTHENMVKYIWTVRGKS